MTDLLAFSDRHRSDTWQAGSIGLGQAVLATDGWDDGRQAGPIVVDGLACIVGDVRLDGRSDLVDRLIAHRILTTAEAGRCTDAHLVLRAYALWGEQLVDHLRGDFSFIIWDDERRQMFGARDHFGIRPLYVADLDEVVIVSSSIVCLRHHSAVSDRLNDQAIGDFLLVGYNHDLRTTAYADVRRVPPAHALSWRRSTDRLRVARYWSLPTNGRVRHRRPDDYVSEFSSLLTTAVRDRLRTSRVGVMMSGGLDSTSVAVIAHEVLSARAEPPRLRAYTYGYARWIRDEEALFARMVAMGLGIPLEVSAIDDMKLFEWQLTRDEASPEPNGDSHAATDWLALRAMSGSCAVCLTGYGADAGLYYGSAAYLRRELASGRTARAALELGRFLFTERRFPLLGIRTGLKRRFGIRSWRPDYPAGLNPDFERRLDLRSRWETLTADEPAAHPVRPDAYGMLLAPYWPGKLETLDPAATRVPVVVRHPFLDVRLVEYLLAIPPLPWFEGKHLLRQAMRGRLPEPVRVRRKPALAQPVHHLPCGFDNVPADDRLSRYVRLVRPGRVGADLPPAVICLNDWLRRQDRVSSQAARSSSLMDAACQAR
jgi:asparagine synthase (glutamine-hydrolysing)